MRIAVVNWSSRQTGGVERYLAGVIPGLVTRGHAVSLWYDQDEPSDRLRIVSGEQVSEHQLPMAPVAAEASVRAWRPDVIFLHNLDDVGRTALLQSLAPTVFFAHAYYGTCISGTKTHQSRGPSPCHRTLGAPCLLHYFPHRCGGRNPLTMVRLYRKETRRRDLLGGYAAIVTASEHMRREYIRNGAGDAHVHALPMYAVEQTQFRAEVGPPIADNSPVRLAFIGRMDPLKGAARLLESLNLVRQATGREVIATLAGDGPERVVLERLVGELPMGTSVTFPGWLDDSARTALLDSIDLLVVPSLWPEPFGMVGPEAGARGVPAAAFDVGGVRAWLTPGTSGELAGGERGDPAELADAIARCVATPSAHARLRSGARRLAERFTVDKHLDALEAVLSAAAHRVELQSN